MSHQLCLEASTLRAPMLRQALLAAAARSELPPDCCGHSPVRERDRDLGYYHAGVTQPEYGFGLTASVQEVDEALERLVAEGLLEQRRHYLGAPEPTARDLRTARRRWRTGELGDYRGFCHLFLRVAA